VGMDRLRERLSEGSPPLRVSEFARMIGYSPTYVRKLLNAGVLACVSLPAGLGRVEEPERRIPVTEAAKFARELRLLD
jgi:hypothetical protein